MSLCKVHGEDCLICGEAAGFELKIVFNAELSALKAEIADLKESFGDKEETCEAIKMENANLTKQLSETKDKLTEATRESWSYWKKSYQDIAGKVNDYKQKWSSAQSKLGVAEKIRQESEVSLAAYEARIVILGPFETSAVQKGKDIAIPKPESLKRLLDKLAAQEKWIERGRELLKRWDFLACKNTQISMESDIKLVDDSLAFLEEKGV